MVQNAGVTEPGGTEIVCAECGTVNSTSETFCAGCGAFLEWQTRTQPTVPGPKPVIPQAGRTAQGRTSPGRSTGPQRSGRSLKAQVSTNTLRGEAGSTLPLQIDLHNLGTTVDRISVELLGPAEEWATIEPPAINLLPGTSGTITVTIQLPGRSEVPGPVVDYGLGIRSSQHPAESILRRGEIQIESFTDVQARLRPTVLRASGPARATVSVSNDGIAPVSLTLTGDDAEGILEFGFAPPRIDLAPRSTGDVTVRIAPREGSRQDQPHPVSFAIVLVETDGPSQRLDGTYIPETPPPPAPPRVEAPAAPPPPAVVTVTSGRSGLGPWGCVIGILVGLIVAIGAVSLVGYLACSANEQCSAACLEGGLSSPGCTVCELGFDAPWCSPTGVDPAPQEPAPVDPDQPDVGTGEEPAPEN